MAGTVEQLQYNLVVQSRAEGNAVEKTTQDLIKLGNVQQQLQQMMAPEKVRVLEHAFYDLDAALQKEAATVRKEGESQADADVRRAKAIQTVQTLRSEMDKVQAATAKIDKGNQAAEKSSRNAGLGFMALGNAVQDAQYGLAGVLNNIPQIITLFGGTAGLAGAVSIAAVALNIFWQRAQEATKAAQVSTQAADDMAKKFVEVSGTKMDEKLAAIGVSAEAAEQGMRLLVEQEQRRLELGKQLDDINRQEADSTDQLAAAFARYREKIDGVNASEELRRLALAKSHRDADSAIEAETVKVKQAEIAYADLTRQYQSLVASREAAKAAIDQANTDKGPLVERSKSYAAIPNGAGRDRQATVDAQIAQLDAIIKDSTKKLQDNQQQMANLDNAAVTLGGAVDEAKKSAAATIEKINKDLESKTQQSDLDQGLAENKALADKLLAAVSSYQNFSPAQAQAAETIRAAAEDGVISAQEIQKVSAALKVLFGSLNDSFKVTNGTIGQLLTAVQNQAQKQAELESKVSTLINQQGYR